MRGSATTGKCIGVILMLIVTSAMAWQPSEDISGYLPKSGEVAGWPLSDEVKYYHGDELFLMINGGADIYNEYGFVRVMSAQYIDGDGKLIKLEIYEMKNPAAAYGIFSFKIGDDGQALTIGQEALLENYYLNFWKGNMLVTVIGSDSKEETVQGVVALAKAVDARIPWMGERPELADLLLHEPPEFQHPTYVLGILGIMNDYIFDTQNIFRVREGMIGIVDGCRTFVFRYADNTERADAFESAISILDASPRFSNQTPQKTRYVMVDRDKATVVINQVGRYIAVMIGPDQDKVTATLKRLTDKLKGDPVGFF